MGKVQVNVKTNRMGSESLFYSVDVEWSFNEKTLGETAPRAKIKTTTKN